MDLHQFYFWQNGWLPGVSNIIGRPIAKIIGVKLD
jgi:hypothetical protein